MLVACRLMDKYHPLAFRRQSHYNQWLIYDFKLTILRNNIDRGGEVSVLTFIVRRYSRETGVFYFFYHSVVLVIMVR